MLFLHDLFVNGRTFLYIIYVRSIKTVDVVHCLFLHVIVDATFYIGIKAMRFALSAIMC